MQAETFMKIHNENRSPSRDELCEWIGQWEDDRVARETNHVKELSHLTQTRFPDKSLMDLPLSDMDEKVSARIILQEILQMQVMLCNLLLEETISFDRNNAAAREDHLQDTQIRQTQQDQHCEITVATHHCDKKVFGDTHEDRRSLKPTTLTEDEVMNLTVRETHVLQMVVDGLSNAEIGERLFLSEQTIKKELSTIMRKLDVTNRVQIAVFAIREGFVK